MNNCGYDPNALIAENISFIPTPPDTSTNVQEAIDEINGRAFGEMTSSLSITTKDFVAGLTPWEGFYELEIGQFKNITLNPNTAPTPSSIKIDQEGIYQYAISLNLTAPAGGIIRTFEVASFIDGIGPIQISSFSLETNQTISLTYTGLANLALNATIDIRIRKTNGQAITLTLSRVNYTITRIA